MFDGFGGRKIQTLRSLVIVVMDKSELTTISVSGGSRNWRSRCATSCGAASPTTAPRKAKRRRPREEIVDYIVEIDDWDWSYSLSLNSERHAIDPYHEFRHLKIGGRLHPKGLKTDRVEITLLPSYDMLPEAGKERQPRCVGSLDIYDDRVTGLVSIPMDAIPPIF